MLPSVSLLVSAVSDCPVWSLVTLQQSLLRMAGPPCYFGYRGSLSRLSVLRLPYMAAFFLLCWASSGSLERVSAFLHSSEEQKGHLLSLHMAILCTILLKLISNLSFSHGSCPTRVPVPRRFGNIINVQLCWEERSKASYAGIFPKLIWV